MSHNSNKQETLTQVAQNIQSIEPKKVKNNVVACTEFLAGLVLNKKTIRHIFREDIMKESVIYQDIIQQGKQKGIQQEQESIAFKMLQEKMAIDLIVKLTNLPLERVQELQSQVEGLQ